MAAAFSPSSWLLGVTTYLTTDIAPIPLLWVGLLAVYLLSFILVFGKTPAGLHKMLTQALPILVLLLLFMMVSNSRINILAALALHTIGLFAAAMVCHGELALIGLLLSISPSFTCGCRSAAYWVACSMPCWPPLFSAISLSIR